ncbi:MAG TPA: MerR family transcriptional regulator [Bacilli bacterium]|nr:MerR family transcriptional regulator [Bacilli bacterium]
MAEQDGKYNIKAISTLLGIQPGTLRAWERRYQIIEPIRNQAGHRLYTDEHVSVLRWLIDKVNKGFTIGQAVGLLEKGDVRLEKEANYLYEDNLDRLRQELLNELLQFRDEKAEMLLSQAYSLFHYEKVLLDVLSPLLVKIGEMWEEGNITVAHEHFISSFLRTKIGQVFQSFASEPYLPKVVAVCAPGEAHEFGLLMFTIFLRRKGFDVIYLGAGIPQKDVEEVTEITNAKFLFISCSLQSHLPAALKMLEAFKERIVVGLGGAALTNLSAEKKERFEKYIVGQDILEWDRWLSEKLQR